MLYICIPAYNEAPTVGVLLWRIRKVFQEFPREYEILVYNDGSTDATGETLAGYNDVLPLTTVGGDGAEHHIGYGRAVDQLLRTAAQRTRYARRDAAIVMQADFTDQPEHIPELVKRFEGGADVVVAEHAGDGSVPTPVRRLRRVAPWVLRPFVSLDTKDPFGTFRLYRVAVLRDAIKAVGNHPLAKSDGWGANVELLLAATPHARKIDSVRLAARYDIRPRASRVRPFAAAVDLYRVGRSERGRTTRVDSAPSRETST